MAQELGYVQMSVTSAVGLTVSGLTTAQQNVLDYVVITCEGNGLRWRGDGTSPTASVGQPIAVTTPASVVNAFTYDDPAKILSGAFKIISQTGTSTVNVTFFEGKPVG